VVKPGDRIFLNDGLVQLVVERVVGNDVECTVAVGGELRSRKGLNLPGIDLGISAFTENDRACLEFALKEGVDAVSQSFVERAADIEAVRTAAAKIGAQPFIIAKIERADALAHFDEILAAADGIMVARGDLGVEVPIEEIAYTQKQLIAKANLAGKPAITATQMLESMVLSVCLRAQRRLMWPTRYLTAPIASCSRANQRWATFPRKQSRCWRKSPHSPKHIGLRGALRLNANSCSGRQRLLAAIAWHPWSSTHLYTVPCDLVLVPTRGGNIARAISRFKPPVWIIAPSSDCAACQNLAFSYGVYPSISPRNRMTGANGLRLAARERNDRRTGHACAGPSPRNPKANYRIELMRLDAEKS
jgi:Pyruvate kinase